jgi:hypothetical protein
MLVVMMRMRRWCLCARLAEPSPLLVAVMLARSPLAAGSNPVGWTRQASTFPSPMLQCMFQLFQMFQMYVAIVSF